MSDDLLLKWLLENGVASWNRRRRRAQTDFGKRPWSSSPGSGMAFPDFSHDNFWWAFRRYGRPNETWPISLAGIDFTQVNLSHAMLRLVDLSDAKMVAARLSGTNLNETILTNAILRHATLLGTDLEEADLTGADLRDAILTDANLQNAILTKTDLTTANLVGANLSGANLSEAVLFPPSTTSPKQYGRRLRTITTITDLLNVTRRLRRHHDGRDEDIQFYFRGESKCAWELKSSVKRGGFAASESNMLLELISRRPEEFSDVPSSLAQWVVAQHHGLKTRFLDVTKNPMIALFHACQENDELDTEDARLHIFAVPRSLVKAFNSDTASVIANFAKLTKREQDLLLGKDQVQLGHAYRVPNYYQAAMDRLCQLIQEEKPYFQNRIDIRDLFRVFVVEPQQHSERLRVQSGAFLVSAFHERFERAEIERQIPDVPVYAHYALTIPHDRKVHIVEDLQLINITRETLFPGLDESAKAITAFYAD